MPPVNEAIIAAMKAIEASKPHIDPAMLSRFSKDVDVAKTRFLTKDKPIKQPWKDKTKAAYVQGFADYMEKQAWIFSLPLGGMDVPQLTDIPKYLRDAAHGGSPEDSKKSPFRSLGMAGLAGLSGLFGLGFAGMGARDMALKLALLARKSKGLGAATAAEKVLEHKMTVPAYQRFGKDFAEVAPHKILEKPLEYTGKAIGGIAHPFNKLEDAASKKLVDVLGANRSHDLAALVDQVGSHPLVDNPATRFAGSFWSIPLLVAGDSLFSPYRQNPNEETKT